MYIKCNNPMIPKVAVNWLTGYAHFAGDNVRFNPDGSGFVAGGNISWDIAGNATFNGTLSGASGTFTGLLCAVNGEIMIQNTHISNGGYDWSGLAITKETSINNDLATIGARWGDGGYNYGRIALVKRNASNNVQQTGGIFLSAGDDVIDCQVIQGSTGYGGITNPVAFPSNVISGSGTYNLPTSPKTGMWVAVKGTTGDITVKSMSANIMQSSSSTTVSSVSVGRNSAILVYEGTYWVVFMCN